MTEIKYDEFTNCLCYDNDDNFLKWRILFPPKLHSNKLYQRNNINLNVTMPTSSPSNPKRKNRNHRNNTRYKTQPITFDEIIEADEETVADINNNNINNNNIYNNNNSPQKNNNIRDNIHNNTRVLTTFPAFANCCSTDSYFRKTSLNNNIPEVDEQSDVFNNPKTDHTEETETDRKQKVSAAEMEEAWKRRRSLRLMRNSVAEEDEVDE